MNFRGHALKFCRVAGLPVLEPFIRLAAGEEPKEQMLGIAKFLLMPMATVGIFIGLWSFASNTVVTGSARLPGPVATWNAGMELIQMHQVQKAADRTLIESKARPVAKADQLKQSAIEDVNHVSSSAPTFVDQIIASLKTVFFGFFIATSIAVPVGVLCGMSPWCNAALTPLIQVFKPVSPLAWLPLAGLVIIWAYSGTQAEEMVFDKAFLISAVTVSLCSLWPTLIHTTLGVSSVNKDYLNVAKVLKLSRSQQLFKIILPASLPLVFTGLRISLGMGWMVLLVADMLAQNPGLGKFVWDEFQNGSSQTYARITFSVLVIGMIGLLLDRIMICLRNLVSFENPATA